jgi:putative ABC transport system ATP-binding protein
MTDQKSIVLEMRQAGRQYVGPRGIVSALADVDLTVRLGELVAVVGRSGCGKSTLLNLAGGLDQPSLGSVRVNGIELGTLSGKELAATRRRHIGFVFQALNLLPTLTAAENVALPLELDGATTAAARTAALTSMADTETAALADAYPDELSGGERQRVAVARALVGDRNLLLADEPTGALDEATADAVVRVIRRRVDTGTCGGVLVTHDMSLAAYADTIVRLRDGRIDSVTETNFTDADFERADLFGTDPEGTLR